MSQFTIKYPIVSKYLTVPSKRRSGKIISKVVFIVAHDTGNPNSTAKNNVNYYENSRDEMSASAHLFVDDKEIIECVPALTGTPEKAWHVFYNVTTDNQLYGVNANDAAIGVEYCYGSKINADEAYKRYVWVLAFICWKFNLDPQKAITGHCFLDPTRKTDPVTGLMQSRRTYEQLLRDVVAEYAECAGVQSLNTVTVVPPKTGKVKATVKLNVRSGSPSTRAAVITVVPSGTIIEYADVVQGDAVNGNTTWYKDTNGNFFWGGGVVPL
jgi:N-acetylmuramoyl-L-alanine amidase